MNPALLAGLIQLGTQYGIPLVEQAISAIKGNPQQQAETDAAYIARLNADTDATLADASGKDAIAEQ